MDFIDRHRQQRAKLQQSCPPTRSPTATPAAPPTLGSSHTHTDTRSAVCGKREREAGTKDVQSKVGTDVRMAHTRCRFGLATVANKQTLKNYLSADGNAASTCSTSCNCRLYPLHTTHAGTVLRSARQHCQAELLEQGRSEGVDVSTTNIQDQI